MDFKPIHDYLNRSSWRINENANFNYSWSGLLSFVANNLMANYALKEMPPEASEAHINGDIHIHNLEGPIIPYCMGNDLLALLTKGIKSASITSGPAKHFNTAIDHVVNALYMLQLESAGAQAYSDFNTLLAPFVAHDHLNEKEVKQHIQRLVFNLNYTNRQAYQSVFSNLTFNPTTPKLLREQPAIIGGKPIEDTLESFEDEALMILEVFNQVLLDRDHEGKPFTFPIPTLNLFNNAFRVDLESVFEVSRLLGSWYFQNYIGSGIDESAVRAMCCRLQLNLEELAPARGLWNFSGTTGSLGVVSINMARLGYLSKDEDDIFSRLDKLLEIAKSFLLWKETEVRKSLDRGLLPMAKFYGLNLDRYFRTIGMVGFNELFINFTERPLSENVDLAYKILSYIREWTKKTQIETGRLWNLELTPGEGSSYRLALIDRKRFKNIFTQGNSKEPYYSTLLTPPNQDLSFVERLRIEEKLLPLFSGGTVFRTYIGEVLDLEQTRKLISRLASTKIPYFDLTATYSICSSCGNMVVGVVETCSECGSPNEIYSRVVGYYRPVSKWNIGKKREFRERKYYASSQILD